MLLINLKKGNKKQQNKTRKLVSLLKILLDLLEGQRAVDWNLLPKKLKNRM